jgi:transitional endoplasmic reticulum ATPase
MDGIEDLKGVLVLGATNRPDILDPALLRPGRFDSVVEIPPPRQEDRQAIFAVHLRGKPLAEGIDVEGLAARSEGLTGADIASVCSTAARQAIRRAVQQAPEARTRVVVEGGDLDEALAQARAGREEGER